MSFPEIKAAIDQTAQSFDAFKVDHAKRVDALKSGQDQLQERIEIIEAKGMRPGLTKPEQEAKAAEHWLAEDGTRLPILRKGMDFRAFYDEPGDATLADFLRGVAGMQVKSEASRKSLSVGTNTAGGYAVPTVLMPGILDALVPASSLLTAGAGVMDVSANDAKQFDIAALDAIPTASWRLENGAVAESDPTFRLVSAAPKSLAFYFKVSRELLADARNLESALRNAIAQAFAKELDRAGLRGTGTAPEPRGILNTSGIQAVANGANGAALAGYANFLSAVQAVLSADAPMPTAAIMAPRSLVKLGGLVDTTGQPLKAPPLLERMQFVTSSQIPVNLTVGSSSDASEIYLGNFGVVTFVMREAPSIMLARETFALNGQIGFVCHVRADVMVQRPSALAVITGVRA